MTRAASLWRVAGEGGRYLIAAGLAFVLDFATYLALIHVADVSYLLAAPIGFAVGLATIYGLSVRWVFHARRLADARAEFFVFAMIGLAGMALNQLIVWAGVEVVRLSAEGAKLLSASLVFGFNFGLRKALLFRR